jgi:hypothetical protein
VPRWSSILVPVVAYVAAGIVVPICVLIWLLSHHQPPYVLDRAAMGSPRTALGGNSVSVRPVSGVFDIVADGGRIAVYPDGSTATLVRTVRPNQVIAKYASTLNERSSSSFTMGGFTERNATLADGRVARTFGIDESVFAFVAPSRPALDRLVAQSAVRRNTKRDVGNDVLDGHTAAALLIGAGWFLLASLLAVLAIVRAFAGPVAAPPPVPWYQRPS